MLHCRLSKALVCRVCYLFALLTLDNLINHTACRRVFYIPSSLGLSVRNAPPPHGKQTRSRSGQTPFQLLSEKINDGSGLWSSSVTSPASSHLTWIPHQTAACHSNTLHLTHQSFRTTGCMRSTSTAFTLSQTISF